MAGIASGDQFLRDRKTRCGQAVPDHPGTFDMPGTDPDRDRASRGMHVSGAQWEKGSEEGSSLLMSKLHSSRARGQKRPVNQHSAAPR